MSSTGHRILSNALPTGKANPSHDGPSGGGRAFQLEPVGTIDSPGQTQESMSWSPDGRFLATCNDENVIVWRLPGKSNLKNQRHGNSNIDAPSTMSDDDKMAKVESNGRGCAHVLSGRY